ncbi:MAG: hypothetical protein WBG43_11390 [Marinifilaceae bacterium]
MNKILSVLLILLTTLVSNAQDRGPADGVLGNINKREYVPINSILKYELELDDTGAGNTSIQLKIMGGEVVNINYLNENLLPSRSIKQGFTNYYYKDLKGNSGKVTVSVKWTELGGVNNFFDGFIKLRQENSVVCFDDNCSVFYTKIIDKPYFTFGLGGFDGGSCAGDVGVLQVFFGGNEEWAVGETRSFELYGYNGQKIQKTLVKADVKTSSAATALGFRYVYEIPLTSPVDFKSTDTYIVSTISTSVVMKNGANNNDNILIVRNRYKRPWIITPIPKENPIKHN